eukprot:5994401-Lingulodinium_polyedra.AAC.1
MKGVMPRSIDLDQVDCLDEAQKVELLCAKGGIQASCAEVSGLGARLFGGHAQGAPVGHPQVAQAIDRDFWARVGKGWE